MTSPKNTDQYLSYPSSVANKQQALIVREPSMSYDCSLLPPLMANGLVESIPAVTGDHYYRSQHHRYLNDHQMVLADQLCPINANESDGNHKTSLTHWGQHSVIPTVVDDCLESLDMQTIETSIRFVRDIQNRVLNQMRETHEHQLMAILKTYKCLAITSLDARKRDLKMLANFVTAERVRFGRSLDPFVQQLSDALNETKEAKKRFKRDVSAFKERIIVDVYRKHELPVFDGQSLPILPDLLAFYKQLPDKLRHHSINSQNADQNIVDGVKDHNMYQRIDNKPIVINNIETKQTDKEPNITITSDTVVDEVVVKESNEMILNGDNCQSVDIKQTNGLNNAIVDQKKNREFAICRRGRGRGRGQKVALSDLNIHGSVKPVTVEANHNESNMTPMKPIVEKTNETKIMNDSVPSAVVTDRNGIQLKAPQMKLLDKLRDKYSQLSDESLIDAMNKTKENVINSGQKNGFSGLKVVDIIAKISDYIDCQVRAPAVNPFVSLGPKCGVCLIPIISQTVTYLSCGHTFHSWCLRHWSQTNNRCATCCKTMNV